MRYLILAPNYSSSCIRDEFSEYIDLDSLSLPKDFLEKLEHWHSEYRKIIPLTEEERAKKRDIINNLDKIGISLAKQITNFIEGGVKIKYYSEGHLKFLPIL